jgi:hypothetical protein
MTTRRPERKSLGPISNHDAALRQHPPEQVPEWAGFGALEPARAWLIFPATAEREVTEVRNPTGS